VYYVLLDEVQFLDRFEEVLNSLLRIENVVYNELLARGYSVDVGVVEVNQRNIDSLDFLTG